MDAGRADRWSGRCGSRSRWSAATQWELVEPQDGRQRLRAASWPSAGQGVHHVGVRCAELSADGTGRAGRPRAGGAARAVKYINGVTFCVPRDRRRPRVSSPSCSSAPAGPGAGSRTRRTRRTDEPRKGPLEGQVLWSPAGRARTTRCRPVPRLAARQRGLDFAGYDELWRWSVTDLEGFWAALWEFFEVRAHAPYERVLGVARDAGRGVVPRRAAELRRAHASARDEDRDASRSSRARRRASPFELTFGELREQVARARAGPAAPRRRRGRPRGRLPAEHPRDAGRVPGDARASARSGRRARRSSASRSVVDRFGAARAEGAAGGRRLPLRRQADRPARRGRRDPRGAADARDVVARALRGGADDALPDAVALGRAAGRAGAARVRPAAVRPPALRAVLVGHDRPAEGDRPRPRRHPASST